MDIKALQSDTHSFSTFRLIIGYLETGGNPKAPFIGKFMHTHSITWEDLLGYVHPNRLLDVHGTLIAAQLMPSTNLDVWLERSGTEKTKPLG